jgi:hypothetical protein
MSKFKKNKIFNLKQKTKFPFFENQFIFTWRLSLRNSGCGGRCPVSGWRQRDSCIKQIIAD